MTINFTSPALMNGSTNIGSMNSITQYQGKFVAIGTDGTYPTFSISLNGSTWTTPARMFNTHVSMVSLTVNSSGLFVAVGGIQTDSIVNAVFSTSSDGSTWSAPALMNGSTDTVVMTSVTVDSSGHFVAVGIGGDTSSPFFSRSSDGSTWTTPALMNGSTAFTNSVMNSVTQYQGKFISVGSDQSGTVWYPLFSTSLDGLNWATPALINGSTNSAFMTSVTVNSAGLFVAVGYSQSNYPLFSTSSDGVTWTTPAIINNTTTQANLLSVTVNSSGLFIAIGINSGYYPIYATSSNGSDWTSPILINGGTLFTQMNSITVNSSGLFVAVGVLDDTNPGFSVGFSGNAPCFLEGTKILCNVDNKEKYIEIEKIREGMLVKTSLNGFKPVYAVGSRQLYNPATPNRIKDRLYVCKKEAYPELTEDLYITGCHSILVNDITDTQRQLTKDLLGRIFVTDRKYRLLACVDERSVPFEKEGTFSIWHVALEHEDIKMNYGIYANGLLVESCCKDHMKKFTLVK